MTVWVVYDRMNEEVLGVFSTEARATAYVSAERIAGQASADPYVVDRGKPLGRTA